MEVNGQTKIIGFIGSTYQTSKMYNLYNTAFKALNLNYIYIPLVFTNLEKGVLGIRNLGIHGIGVTTPYKIDIIKYLDEIDKNAQKIGAVNAVINNNGKLIGYNTDGLGAVKALDEQNIMVKNKKIIILGNGGASKSIAKALSDIGGKVVVLNRKSLNSLSFEIKNTDTLINTTPVGMFPKINDSLVPSQILFKALTVMDIITNPKETKLIKEAKQKDCKIIYGERMLFWQAVEKFKLFTGRVAPIKEMEKALC